MGAEIQDNQIKDIQWNNLEFFLKIVQRAGLPNRGLRVPI